MARNLFFQNYQGEGDESTSLAVNISPETTTNSTWQGNVGKATTVSDSPGQQVTMTVDSLYGNGIPTFTTITSASNPQTSVAPFSGEGGPKSALQAAHAAAFASTYEDVFDENAITTQSTLTPTPTRSSSPWASYWSNVAETAKGYFIDGPVNMVKGLVESAYQLVTDPVGTFNNYANIVRHPFDTAKALYQHYSELAQSNRGQGEIAFELASALGPAGLAKLDKIRTASKIAKAAEAATVADASRVATIATDTEEALAAAKANEATRAGEVANEASANAASEFVTENAGCFFAGTLVATEFGSKAVERVGADHLVWAYNFVVGQWELRHVVETYQTDYVGEKIRINVAGEWIESTRHHPIWVVDGKDLQIRPRPEHVKRAEQDAVGGMGRWVDAGDLRVGDVLLLKPDRRAKIRAIQVQLVVATVYNFQVEGLHNYAVGNARVLVHNNAPCSKGASNVLDATENVQPYDVDSYGNLQQRSQVGDGLSLDHQPSNASNIAREEAKLGRQLNAQERAAIRDQGPAVAVPEELHRAGSPTYGGRNAAAQIAADAADPIAAVSRDTQAMINAASEAYKSAAVAAAAKLRLLAGG